MSEKALTAEKDHVEGFAPEVRGVCQTAVAFCALQLTNCTPACRVQVAWVTRSGDTELEAPIAVRPTSETVMYPVYATWIRSHRDLPLKLNQWCNVVRWEFKHPTPFIRSREFLWQEGHTVFATKAEADAEVRSILDKYKAVYEQLLAVPVIQGVKSEKEKFAGGLYTTTVEAFVPATGRGIQAATSHCLGQNFAKMFGIEFENVDGGRSLAWQNSWGLTTRSIGVAVMVHGDDQGLVLPPAVAPIQIVLVPIPNAKLSAEEKAALFGGAAAAAAALTTAGHRVRLDERENYTPGWKYNHWELKGVPLRCEFGPRDVTAGTCVLVRRDTRAKETVPLAQLPARAGELLKEMQAGLLAKATAERNSRIVNVTQWADFVPALDKKCMVLAPWCEEPESEEWVKRESGKLSDRGAAKTLCIPFEQPPLAPGTPCFTGNGKVAICWALWGRSY